MIHSLLTLSRVLLAPFCYLSIKKGQVLIPTIMITYAVISDYLDGLVARLMKKESQNGALFDVAADKVFIYFTAYAFLNTAHSNMCALFLIWIARDLILLISWLFSHNSFSSLKLGKLYTFFQFITIFSFAICSIMKIEVHNYIITTISLFFAVFALFTIMQYHSAFNKIHK